MRNVNGYGSIVNLGKKRRRQYGIRITTGFSEDGKQKRKYLSYHETKKEALIALAKYNENPFDLNTHDITFEDIFKLWHADQQNKMSSKNLISYSSAYKHTKLVQKMKMKDIKTVHLQKIIDENKKGYDTKVKIKQLCSKLYKYCEQNDIINKNYAKFIEIPTNTDPRDRKPFTSAVIYDLLHCKVSDITDIAIILLFTGARVNEILQLKTNNIHLDERYIITGLKTKAGKNRMIPISKTISPILEKYYNQNNEYLFNIQYANYRKKWLKHALLKDYKIHDTRHTFATICNNLDINRTSVKKILGHSSQDITERVYTHKNIDELLKVIDEYEKYILAIKKSA